MIESCPLVWLSAGLIYDGYDTLKQGFYYSERMCTQHNIHIYIVDNRVTYTVTVWPMHNIWTRNVYGFHLMQTNGNGQWNTQYFGYFINNWYVNRPVNHASVSSVRWYALFLFKSLSFSLSHSPIAFTIRRSAFILERERERCYANGLHFSIHIFSFIVIIILSRWIMKI